MYILEELGALGTTGLRRKRPTADAQQASESATDAGWSEPKWPN
jgi:hypothetical protein